MSHSLKKVLLATAAIVAFSAKAEAQLSVQIPNVAAFALSSYGSYVHTQGFKTPGDGGAADFYRNGTVCAPDGYTIFVDSRGNCFYRVNTGQINIASFGANVSATDNSAAIQAAINYSLSQNAGGSILVPGAFYKYATTLDLKGVGLKGVGRESSGLQYTGTGTAITVSTLNIDQDIGDIFLSAPNASVIVDFSNVLNGEITNVHFSGNGSTTIGVQSYVTSNSQTPYYDMVQNVICANLGKCVYLNNSGGGVFQSPNQWQLNNVQMNNGIVGIDAEFVAGLNLSNINDSNDTGCMLQLGSHGNYVKANNLHLEDDSGAANMFCIDPAALRLEVHGFDVASGHINQTGVWGSNSILDGSYGNVGYLLADASSAFTSGMVADSNTGGAMLYGVEAVSATETNGKNFTLEGTFATSGTLTLPFPRNEADTNYRVSISGNAAETFSWSNKAVGSIQIHSSNASSTATVDVTIFR